MSATTLDVIVDRVRSICVDLPFEYFESERVDMRDMEGLPEGAIDGAFLVEGKSQLAHSWFDYRAELTDLVTVTVTKQIQSDFIGVRRLLYQAASSLTTLIERDGVSSGLYGVVDRGYSRVIVADPTHTYLQLRLTLPCNYEAQF